MPKINDTCVLRGLAKHIEAQVSKLQEDPSKRMLAALHLQLQQYIAGLQVQIDNELLQLAIISHNAEFGTNLILMRTEAGAFVLRDLNAPRDLSDTGPFNTVDDLVEYMNNY